MHFYDQLDLIKAQISTVAIALEFIAEEYGIPGLSDCSKALTAAKHSLMELKAQEGSPRPVDDPQQKESQ